VHINTGLFLVSLGKLCNSTVEIFVRVVVYMSGIKSPKAKVAAPHF